MDVTATLDTSDVSQSVRADKYWKADHPETAEEELFIRLDDAQFPEPWWRATIKWDGCIDLHRIFNKPDWDDEDALIDDLHICDLDDFIIRLLALRAKAKQYFGKQWGEW